MQRMLSYGRRRRCLCHLLPQRILDETLERAQDRLQAGATSLSGCRYIRRHHLSPARYYLQPEVRTTVDRTKRERYPRSEERCSATLGHFVLHTVSLAPRCRAICSLRGSMFGTCKVPLGNARPLVEMILRRKYSILRSLVVPQGTLTDLLLFGSRVRIYQNARGRFLRTSPGQSACFVPTMTCSATSSSTKSSTSHCPAALNLPSTSQERSWDRSTASSRGRRIRNVTLTGSSGPLYLTRSP